MVSVLAMVVKLAIVTAFIAFFVARMRRKTKDRETICSRMAVAMFVISIMSLNLYIALSIAEHFVLGPIAVEVPWSY